MAAFCACCGAEITLKKEACPIFCGTPQHGMVQPHPAFDASKDPSQKDVDGRKLYSLLSCKSQ